MNATRRIADKTLRKAAAAAALVFLASGCGGGGTPTVPEAQPAEETQASIGAHTVHFSAQSTDQLPMDVARAYNIVRSKNRAMLTVSIIDDAATQSVTGEVSVKTENLTGQLKNVIVREIREPGETEAIYYIGETPVANQETLIFTITVQPDGVDTPSTVRFRRQFYTD